MTAPARIQRRRTKGWRMPPGTVYVGRPSVHANPYQIRRHVLPGGGEEFSVHARDELPKPPQPHAHLTQGQAHEVAARAFRAWVDSLGPSYARGLVLSLGGADLACWCRPDLACHADALLELANPPEQGRP